MKTNKGFTLIELLVVVLIIGILAAIAVPYYQESVERSIMQEAIINLKNIAQANDAFFLANGRYANAYEMDKLDISIPGTTFSSEYPGRIQTKYFVYSPNGTQKRHKAVAQRKPFNTQYYLAIFPNNKMECGLYGNNSSQKKLCNQINQDGHL